MTTNMNLISTFSRRTFRKYMMHACAKFVTVIPNITIPAGMVNLREVFSLTIKKQKVMSARAENIYVSSMELSNKCEVLAPKMDAMTSAKVVLPVFILTINHTRKTHKAPANALRT